MSLVNLSGEKEEVKEEVTLESLAARMDALGKQMDWLCENLSSLFVFVSQMGQNGGGIRGLMAMLKQGTPVTTTMEDQGA